MNTYIATKEELKETILDAVSEIVTNNISEIVRRATEKKCYTIAEACELLNCTRRHLQYLRDSRQISFVQHAKKIYFRAEDIEAFFNKNYINNNKIEQK